jgi:hypothetical protein
VALIHANQHTVVETSGSIVADEGQERYDEESEGERERSPQETSTYMS